MKIDHFSALRKKFEFHHCKPLAFQCINTNKLSSPGSQTRLKYSEIFLKQMEIGRTPLKQGLGQHLSNTKLREESLALTLVMLLSLPCSPAALMLIYVLTKQKCR